MLRLILRDVVMRYRDLAAPALDLPMLEVEAGGSLAVTGPSGAGKSTFINIVTGLERPSAGRIEWQGEDIARLSEAARDAWRARNVGLVMQEFHLFPGLGALDNVLLPTRFRHLRLPAGVRERAATLLERVGIGLGARGIETFSRGEMQRVAIARALLSRPGVIIADEPTASLDGGSAASVCDLLTTLAGEEKATLIAVTHDPALVARLGRRIALVGGRCVTDSREQAA